MDGWHAVNIGTDSHFFASQDLEEMLEDLTQKGYLKFEHPKKLIRETNENGVVTIRREYDTTKPKGYNIVAGKLSFEINKVMSPNEIAPTLVAMDMQKLYVGDNGGLKKIITSRRIATLRLSRQY